MAETLIGGHAGNRSSPRVTSGTHDGCRNTAGRAGMPSWRAARTAVMTAVSMTASRGPAPAQLNGQHA